MQDQPFQETLDQNVQVYLVEKDPESYAEAMASHDAPFCWKLLMMKCTPLCQTIHGFYQTSLLDVSLLIVDGALERNKNLMEP